ncbi:hypothetical protein BGLA2_510028 [Burkholderia gladioli]|nr:hypothetical protein BGLA2_510028 [Burkholderia gladioli]
MDAHQLAQGIDSAWLQQDRLLKLDSPLEGTVLLPLRASGSARLGRHFEFTVDVASRDDTLELKALIAQPVTLWIQQSHESYRPHHGYVHTA